MKSNGRHEVVVITGASAGLGRAIAQEFARQGARIGLLARGEQGLLGAQHDVEHLGGRALAIPTDVSDPTQIEAAAEQIEKEFGPIDVWVNNAMVTVFAPFDQITPDEFKRVTEVTYLGYVYGTMTALHRMLPRDRGVIVQVGSALADRSIPLQSAYCGAKHAIEGFTDSIRSELIHKRSRVRITMVQMPAMNTPQFRLSRSKLPNKAQPVPPIFQPEVGARAVVHAAHHTPREMWIGAPTVKAIVGGFFIPGLLDRLLAKKAYSGQQIDEPRDPNRPDNLFEPVPGDHGAHGPYDERSSSYSAQAWASRHPVAAAAAVMGTAILGAYAIGTALGSNGSRERRRRPARSAARRTLAMLRQ